MPEMTIEPAGTSFLSDPPRPSGERRARACVRSWGRPSSDGDGSDGGVVVTEPPWNDSAARDPTDGVGSATMPCPAAQRPQSAWLNVWISPGFGWFVPSDTAPGRSPRTSSTKPLSAFFGPTSTKVRTPERQSVSIPSTQRTGEKTCFWSVSLISGTVTG